MNGISSYKVVQIRSWAEYAETVTQSYRLWAFRGQADSTWPLMSSLGRYLNSYVKEECWDDQERRILRLFRRKGHLFLKHIPDFSDTFQWLGLMQHYGAPTRLLDFTWSPYVAAFFALEHTVKEAAVWAVNPKRIVTVTGELEDFLKTKGRFHSVDRVGIGEPFIMNDRLIAQSGTFLVTREPGISIDEILGGYDDPSSALVKFELPANLIRSDGMYALYMMNVTNATLFPGLEGLSRSLAYELEFHWKHDPRKL